MCIFSNLHKLFLNLNEHTKYVQEVLSIYKYLTKIGQNISDIDTKVIFENILIRAYLVDTSKLLLTHGTAG